jgi:hypothetical protein
VPAATGAWTLRRLLVPSLAALLWAFVVAGGVFGPDAARSISKDGDPALHILLGDLVRERGWVLPNEPTTFTADDEPFIAHEWLSEVAFSYADSALGLAGPLLLVTLAAATTLALLMRRMREVGASPWPQVLFVVLAMIVMQQHLIVRPHVFAWLLALVWTIRLERLWAGEISWRRWLAWAVPLMVLWTNLHGSFPLAFVLMGLFGLAALLDALTGEEAERARSLATFRRWVLLGLCVLAASGLNPFGFALHLHVLEFASGAAGSVLGATREFRPPDFHHFGPRVFLADALLVLALLILGRRRPATIEWLLPLFLFAQALVSARNAMLFAILSAPIAAARLEAQLRDARAGRSPAARAAAGLLASSERLMASDRRSGGALALALLLGVAVAWLRARGPEAVDFDPGLQPVGALEYVAAHPERFRGRMLNRYPWGGVVSYRLHPGHKTFINGFNDHYGPELLETYLRVANLRDGWRDVLDRYRIEWVLFASDAALTRALLEEPGWRCAYRDELATIVSRAPQTGADHPGCAELTRASPSSAG